MQDDDIDHLSAIPGMPVPPPSGVARWVPAAVVFSAVAGFSALAWYAYHAGVSSLKEEDLVVVEADKTPVKEKPLDPGGMQFPNQDKTIFETFSQNQQPPKVERLLPTPEEPIAKQPDTSETTTWVNDKLKADETKPAEETAKKTETAAAPAAVAPAPAEKPVTGDNITSYTMEKAPAASATTTPPPDKTTKPVAMANMDSALSGKTEKAASSGTAKAQLGAYRSEKEARAAWGVLQKKYKSLSGKSPIIVKADLADKGVYYRLRVGGFADTAAVKSFCSGLSAKGQACIPSKE